jgi:predicted phosphodiesterase
MPPCTFTDAEWIQRSDATSECTVMLQIVPWGSVEAAGSYQRQLDVDILVMGHTHDFKVRAAGLVQLTQHCQ